MRLPSDFQKISKASTLLLLSFGFGAGNGLGIIGAPSYLLSLLDPTWGLLAVFSAGVSFFLFQRFAGPKKIPFIHFSAGAVGLYLILLLSLIFLGGLESLRAFTWVFLSFFGLRMSKWVVSELTTLHLPSQGAQPFFVYHSVLHEAGILAATVGLKCSVQGLSPFQMIEGSAILYLICLLVIVLHSRGKDPVGRKAKEKVLNETYFDDKILKNLAWGVRLVALTIGMAVLCEEQLVRVVIKERMGSFEAVRDLMTNYRLVGSCLLILLGSVAGRWIRMKQTSPFRLLKLNAVGLMVMTALCLSTQWFLLFIVFEVSKRIFEQTFYMPANNIIFSSFFDSFRHKARSLEVFYYFNGASLVLFLFFHYIQGLGLPDQIHMSLALILVLLTFHVLMLFWYRLKVERSFLQAATP